MATIIEPTPAPAELLDAKAVDPRCGTGKVHWRRSSPELLDVKDFAALLGCSPRHVARLHDSDDLPRAVRIGRLLRWRRLEILAWLDAGCPSPRRTGWTFNANAKGGRS